MASYLISLAYFLVVILLLWQAFRVMSRGFLAANLSKPTDQKRQNDRTGRLTIHPELLNKEGKITDEELLTVRFSNDFDPPKQTEPSSE